MKNPETIRALFAFSGFIAASKLVGVFGDRYARVIQLKRRKKQPSVLTVVTDAGDLMIKSFSGYAPYRLLDCESTWSSNAGVSTVRGATACM